MNTKTDILEAFALAELDTETSRWGHIQHRTPARIVRVCEDDGTLSLYVMTPGNEAIESEIKISGHLANPVAMATLIQMAVEL